MVPFFKYSRPPRTRLSTTLTLQGSEGAYTVRLMGNRGQPSQLLAHHQLHAGAGQVQQLGVPISVLANMHVVVLPTASSRTAAAEMHKPNKKEVPQPTTNQRKQPKTIKSR